SDDLLFREAATFHVLVLSMGQNELQTGLDQRGKVTKNGGAAVSEIAGFIEGGVIKVVLHWREGPPASKLKSSP
ncbi:hypothetical protein NKI66_32460, partial [Mesorhizobium sp. M0518]|uniref:hypothetical protein n=1 Tax=Mesorhizobium sp. M0518 TaxID=2956956 RepID=UPI003335931F